MAVFQVTPNARAEVRPVLPFDRAPRLYQASFKLADYKARPAVNDILEVFRLPKGCDLYAAKIVSSAAISGTYKLRLIEGAFNSEDDRDQDTDYGVELKGAAAEENATAQWLATRKSANAEKRAGAGAGLHGGGGGGRDRRGCRFLHVLSQPPGEVSMSGDLTTLYLVFTGRASGDTHIIHRVGERDVVFDFDEGSGKFIYPFRAHADGTPESAEDAHLLAFAATHWPKKPDAGVYAEVVDENGWHMRCKIRRRSSGCLST